MEEEEREREREREREKFQSLCNVKHCVASSEIPTEVSTLFFKTSGVIYFILYFVILSNLLLLQPAEEDFKALQLYSGYLN